MAAIGRRQGTQTSGMRRGRAHRTSSDPQDRRKVNGGVKVPADRHFLRDLQVHRTAPLQQTPGGYRQRSISAAGEAAWYGKRNTPQRGRGGGRPGTPSLQGQLLLLRSPRGRAWMNGKRGGVPRGAAGAHAPRGQHNIQKTNGTHIVHWAATAARTSSAGAAQHRKKTTKNPVKQSTQAAAGALTERPPPRHPPSPPWSPQPTLTRPTDLNHKRGAWKVGT